MFGRISQRTGVKSGTRPRDALCVAALVALVLLAPCASAQFDCTSLADVECSGIYDSLGTISVLLAPATGTGIDTELGGTNFVDITTMGGVVPHGGSTIQGDGAVALTTTVEDTLGANNFLTFWLRCDTGSGAGDGVTTNDATAGGGPVAIECDGSLAIGAGSFTWTPVPDVWAYVLIYGTDSSVVVEINNDRFEESSPGLQATQVSVTGTNSRATVFINGGFDGGASPPPGDDFEDRIGACARCSPVATFFNLDSNICAAGSTITVSPMVARGVGICHNSGGACSVIAEYGGVDAATTSWTGVANLDFTFPGVSNDDVTATDRIAIRDAVTSTNTFDFTPGNALAALIPCAPVSCATLVGMDLSVCIPPLPAGTFETFEGTGSGLGISQLIQGGETTVTSLDVGATTVVNDDAWAEIDGVHTLADTFGTATGGLSFWFYCPFVSGSSDCVVIGGTGAGLPISYCCDGSFDAASTSGFTARQEKPFVAIRLDCDTGGCTFQADQTLDTWTPVPTTVFSTIEVTGVATIDNVFTTNAIGTLPGDAACVVCEPILDVSATTITDCASTPGNEEARSPLTLGITADCVVPTGCPVRIRLEGAQSFRVFDFGSQTQTFEIVGDSSSNIGASSNVEIREVGGVTELYNQPADNAAAVASLPCNTPCTDRLEFVACSLMTPGVTGTLLDGEALTGDSISDTNPTATTFSDGVTPVVNDASFTPGDLVSFGAGLDTAAGFELTLWVFCSTPDDFVILISGADFVFGLGCGGALFPVGAGETDVTTSMNPDRWNLVSFSSNGVPGTLYIRANDGPVLTLPVLLGVTIDALQVAGTAPLVDNVHFTTTPSATATHRGYCAACTDDLIITGVVTDDCNSLSSPPRIGLTLSVTYVCTTGGGCPASVTYGLDTVSVTFPQSASPAVEAVEFPLAASSLIGVADLVSIVDTAAATSVWSALASNAAAAENTACVVGCSDVAANLAPVFMAGVVGGLPSDDWELSSGLGIDVDAGVSVTSVDGGTTIISNTGALDALVPFSAQAATIDTTTQTGTVTFWMRCPALATAADRVVFENTLGDDTRITCSGDIEVAGGLTSVDGFVLDAWNLVSLSYDGSQWFSRVNTREDTINAGLGSVIIGGVRVEGGALYDNSVWQIGVTTNVHLSASAVCPVSPLDIVDVSTSDCASSGVPVQAVELSIVYTCSATPCSADVTHGGFSATVVFPDASGTVVVAVTGEDSSTLDDTDSISVLETTANSVLWSAVASNAVSAEASSCATGDLSVTGVTTNDCGGTASISAIELTVGVSCASAPCSLSVVYGGGTGSATGIAAGTSTLVVAISGTSSFGLDATTVVVVTDDVTAGVVWNQVADNAVLAESTACPSLNLATCVYDTTGIANTVNLRAITTEPSPDEIRCVDDPAHYPQGRYDIGSNNDETHYAALFNDAQQAPFEFVILPTSELGGTMTATVAPASSSATGPGAIIGWPSPFIGSNANPRTVLQAYEGPMDLAIPPALFSRADGSHLFTASESVFEMLIFVPSTSPTADVIIGRLDGVLDANSQPSVGFRVRVVDIGGGASDVFVDCATAEYATIPAPAVAAGQVAHDQWASISYHSTDGGTVAIVNGLVSSALPPQNIGPISIDPDDCSVDPGRTRVTGGLRISALRFWKPADTSVPTKPVPTGASELSASQFDICVAPRGIGAGFTCDEPTATGVMVYCEVGDAMELVSYTDCVGSVVQASIIAPEEFPVNADISGVCCNPAEPVALDRVTGTWNLRSKTDCLAEADRTFISFAGAAFAGANTPTTLCRACGFRCNRLRIIDLTVNLCTGQPSVILEATVAFVCPFPTCPATISYAGATVSFTFPNGAATVVIGPFEDPPGTPKTSDDADEFTVAVVNDLVSGSVPWSSPPSNAASVANLPCAGLILVDSSEFAPRCNFPAFVLAPDTAPVPRPWEITATCTTPVACAFIVYVTNEATYPTSVTGTQGVLLSGMVPALTHQTFRVDIDSQVYDDAVQNVELGQTWYYHVVVDPTDEHVLAVPIVAPTDECRVNLEIIDQPRCNDLDAVSMNPIAGDISMRLRFDDAPADAPFACGNAGDVCELEFTYVVDAVTHTGIATQSTASGVAEWSIPSHILADLSSGILPRCDSVLTPVSVGVAGQTRTPFPTVTVGGSTVPSGVPTALAASTSAESFFGVAQTPCVGGGAVAAGLIVPRVFSIEAACGRAASCELQLFAQGDGLTFDPIGSATLLGSVDVPANTPVASYSISIDGALFDTLVGAASPSLLLYMTQNLATEVVWVGSASPASDCELDAAVVSSSLCCGADGAADGLVEWSVVDAIGATVVTCDSAGGCTVNADIDGTAVAETIANGAPLAGTIDYTLVAAGATLCADVEIEAVSVVGTATYSFPVSTVANPSIEATCSGASGRIDHFLGCLPDFHAQSMDTATAYPAAFDSTLECPSDATSCVFRAFAPGAIALESDTLAPAAPSVTLAGGATQAQRWYFANTDLESVYISGGELAEFVTFTVEVNIDSAGFIIAASATQRASTCGDTVVFTPTGVCCDPRGVLGAGSLVASIESPNGVQRVCSGGCSVDVVFPGGGAQTLTWADGATAATAFSPTSNLGISCAGVVSTAETSGVTTFDFSGTACPSATPTIDAAELPCRHPDADFSVPGEVLVTASCPGGGADCPVRLGLGAGLSVAPDIEGPEMIISAGTTVATRLTISRETMRAVFYPVASWTVRLTNFQTGAFVESTPTIGICGLGLYMTNSAQFCCQNGGAFGAGDFVVTLDGVVARCGDAGGCARELVIRDGGSDAVSATTPSVAIGATGPAFAFQSGQFSCSGTASFGDNGPSAAWSAGDECGGVFTALEADVVLFDACVENDYIPGGIFLSQDLQITYTCAAAPCSYTAQLRTLTIPERTLTVAITGLAVSATPSTLFVPFESANIATTRAQLATFLGDGPFPLTVEVSMFDATFGIDLLSRSLHTIMPCGATATLATTTGACCNAAGNLEGGIETLFRYEYPSGTYNSRCETGGGCTYDLGLGAGTVEVSVAQSSTGAVPVGTGTATAADRVPCAGVAYTVNTGNNAVGAFRSYDFTALAACPAVGSTGLAVLDAAHEGVICSSSNFGDVTTFPLIYTCTQASCEVTVQLFDDATGINSPITVALAGSAAQTTVDVTIPTADFTALAAGSGVADTIQVVATNPADGLVLTEPIAFGACTDAVDVDSRSCCSANSIVGAYHVTLRSNGRERTCDLGGGCNLEFTDGATDLSFSVPNGESEGEVAVPETTSCSYTIQGDGGGDVFATGTEIAVCPAGGIDVVITYTQTGCGFEADFQALSASPTVTVTTTCAAPAGCDGTLTFSADATGHAVSGLSQDDDDMHTFGFNVYPVVATATIEYTPMGASTPTASRTVTVQKCTPFATVATTSVCCDLTTNTLEVEAGGSIDISLYPTNGAPVYTAASDTEDWDFYFGSVPLTAQYPLTGDNEATFASVGATSFPCGGSLQLAPSAATSSAPFLASYFVASTCAPAPPPSADAPIVAAITSEICGWETNIYGWRPDVEVVISCPGTAVVDCSAIIDIANGVRVFTGTAPPGESVTLTTRLSRAQSVDNAFEASTTPTQNTFNVRVGDGNNGNALVQSTDIALDPCGFGIRTFVRNAPCCTGSGLFDGTLRIQTRVNAETANAQASGPVTVEIAGQTYAASVSAGLNRVDIGFDPSIPAQQIPCTANAVATFPGATPLNSQASSSTHADLVTSSTYVAIATCDADAIVSDLDVSTCNPANRDFSRSHTITYSAVCSNAASPGSPCPISFTLTSGTATLTLTGITVADGAGAYSTTFTIGDVDTLLAGGANVLTVEANDVATASVTAAVTVPFQTCEEVYSLNFDAGACCSNGNLEASIGSVGITLDGVPATCDAGVGVQCTEDLQFPGGVRTVTWENLDAAGSLLIVESDEIACDGIVFVPGTFPVIIQASYDFSDVGDVCPASLAQVTSIAYTGCASGVAGGDAQLGESLSVAIACPATTPAASCSVTVSVAGTVYTPAAIADGATSTVTIDYTSSPPIPIATRQNDFPVIVTHSGAPVHVETVDIETCVYSGVLQVAGTGLCCGADGLLDNVASAIVEFSSQEGAATCDTCDTTFAFGDARVQLAGTTATLTPTEFALAGGDLALIPCGGPLALVGDSGDVLAPFASYVVSTACVAAPTTASLVVGEVDLAGTCTTPTEWSVDSGSTDIRVPIECADVASCTFTVTIEGDVSGAATSSPITVGAGAVSVESVATALDPTDVWVEVTVTQTAPVAGVAHQERVARSACAVTYNFAAPGCCDVDTDLFEGEIVLEVLFNGFAAVSTVAGAPTLGGFSLGAYTGAIDTGIVAANAVPCAGDASFAGVSLPYNKVAVCPADAGEALFLSAKLDLGCAAPQANMQNAIEVTIAAVCTSGPCPFEIELATPGGVSIATESDSIPAGETFVSVVLDNTAGFNAESLVAVVSRPGSSAEPFSTPISVPPCDYTVDVGLTGCTCENGIISDTTAATISLSDLNAVGVGGQVCRDPPCAFDVGIGGFTTSLAMAAGTSFAPLAVTAANAIPCDGAVFIDGRAAGALPATCTYPVVGSVTSLAVHSIDVSLMCSYGTVPANPIFDPPAIYTVAYTCLPGDGVATCDFDVSTDAGFSSSTTVTVAAGVSTVELSAPIPALAAGATGTLFVRDSASTDLLHTQVVDTSVACPAPLSDVVFDGCCENGFFVGDVELALRPSAAGARLTCGGTTGCPVTVLNTGAANAVVSIPDGAGSVVLSVTGTSATRVECSAQVQFGVNTGTETFTFDERSPACTDGLLVHAINVVGERPFDADFTGDTINVAVDVSCTRPTSCTYAVESTALATNPSATQTVASGAHETHLFTLAVGVGVSEQFTVVRSPSLSDELEVFRETEDIGEAPFAVEVTFPSGTPVCDIVGGVAGITSGDMALRVFSRGVARACNSGTTCSIDFVVGGTTETFVWNDGDTLSQTVAIPANIPCTGVIQATNWDPVGAYATTNGAAVEPLRVSGASVDVLCSSGAASIASSGQITYTYVCFPEDATANCAFQLVRVDGGVPTAIGGPTTVLRGAGERTLAFDPTGFPVSGSFAFQSIVTGEDLETVVYTISACSLVYEIDFTGCCESGVLNGAVTATATNNGVATTCAAVGGCIIDFNGVTSAAIPSGAESVIVSFVPGDAYPCISTIEDTSMMGTSTLDATGSACTPEFAFIDAVITGGTLPASFDALFPESAVLSLTTQCSLPVGCPVSATVGGMALPGLTSVAFSETTTPFTIEAAPSLEVVITHAGTSAARTVSAPRAHVGLSYTPTSLCCEPSTSLLRSIGGSTGQFVFTTTADGGILTADATGSIVIGFGGVSASIDFTSGSTTSAPFVFADDIYPCSGAFTAGDGTVLGGYGITSACSVATPGVGTHVVIGVRDTSDLCDQRDDFGFQERIRFPSVCTSGTASDCDITATFAGTVLTPITASGTTPNSADASQGNVEFAAALGGSSAESGVLVITEVATSTIIVSELVSRLPCTNLHQADFSGACCLGGVVVGPVSAQLIENGDEVACVESTGCSISIAAASTTSPAPAIALSSGDTIGTRTFSVADALPCTGVLFNLPVTDTTPFDISGKVCAGPIAILAADISGCTPPVATGGSFGVGAEVLVHFDCTDPTQCVVDAVTNGAIASSETFTFLGSTVGTTTYSVPTAQATAPAITVDFRDETTGDILFTETAVLPECAISGVPSFGCGTCFDGVLDGVSVSLTGLGFDGVPVECSGGPCLVPGRLGGVDITWSVAVGGADAVASTTIMASQQIPCSGAADVGGQTVASYNALPACGETFPVVTDIALTNFEYVHCDVQGAALLAGFVPSDPEIRFRAVCRNPNGCTLRIDADPASISGSPVFTQTVNIPGSSTGDYTFTITAGTAATLGTDVAWEFTDTTGGASTVLPILPANIAVGTCVFEHTVSVPLTTCCLASTSLLDGSIDASFTLDGREAVCDNGGSACSVDVTVAGLASATFTVLDGESTVSALATGGMCSGTVTVTSPPTAAASSYAVTRECDANLAVGDFVIDVCVFSRTDWQRASPGSITFDYICTTGTCNAEVSRGGSVIATAAGLAGMGVLTLPISHPVTTLPMLYEVVDTDAGSVIDTFVLTALPCGEALVLTQADCLSAGGFVGDNVRARYDVNGAPAQCIPAGGCSLDLIFTGAQDVVTFTFPSGATGLSAVMPVDETVLQIPPVGTFSISGGDALSAYDARALAGGTVCSEAEPALSAVATNPVGSTNPSLVGFSSTGSFDIEFVCPTSIGPCVFDYTISPGGVTGSTPSLGAGTAGSVTINLGGDVFGSFATTTRSVALELSGTPGGLSTTTLEWEEADLVGAIAFDGGSCCSNGVVDGGFTLTFSIPFISGETCQFAGDCPTDLEFNGVSVTTTDVPSTGSTATSSPALGPDAGEQLIPCIGTVRSASTLQHIVDYAVLTECTSPAPTVSVSTIASAVCASPFANFYPATAQLTFVASCPGAVACNVRFHISIFTVDAVIPAGASAVPQILALTEAQQDMLPTTGYTVRVEDLLTGADIATATLAHDECVVSGLFTGTGACCDQGVELEQQGTLSAAPQLDGTAAICGAGGCTLPFEFAAGTGTELLAAGDSTVSIALAGFNDLPCSGTLRLGSALTPFAYSVSSVCTATYTAGDISLSSTHIGCRGPLTTSTEWEVSVVNPSSEAMSFTLRAAGATVGSPVLVASGASHVFTYTDTSAGATLDLGVQIPGSVIIEATETATACSASSNLLAPATGWTIDFCAAAVAGLGVDGTISIPWTCGVGAGLAGCSGSVHIDDGSTVLELGTITGAASGSGTFTATVSAAQVAAIATPYDINVATDDTASVVAANSDTVTANPVCATTAAFVDDACCEAGDAFGSFTVAYTVEGAAAVCNLPSGCDVDITVPRPSATPLTTTVTIAPGDDSATVSVVASDAVGCSGTVAATGGFSDTYDFSLSPCSATFNIFNVDTAGLCVSTVGGAVPAQSFTVNLACTVASGCNVVARSISPGFVNTVNVASGATTATFAVTAGQSALILGDEEIRVYDGDLAVPVFFDFAVDGDAECATAMVPSFAGCCRAGLAEGTLTIEIQDGGSPLTCTNAGGCAVSVAIGANTYSGVVANGDTSVAIAITGLDGEACTGTFLDAFGGTVVGTYDVSATVCTSALIVSGVSVSSCTADAAHPDLEEAVVYAATYSCTSVTPCSVEVDIGGGAHTIAHTVAAGASGVSFSQAVAGGASLPATYTVTNEDLDTTTVVDTTSVVEAACVLSFVVTEVGTTCTTGGVFEGSLQVEVHVGGAATTCNNAGGCTIAAQLDPAVAVPLTIPDGASSVTHVVVAADAVACPGVLADTASAIAAAPYTGSPAPPPPAPVAAPVPMGLVPAVPSESAVVPDAVFGAAAATIVATALAATIAAAVAPAAALPVAEVSAPLLRGGTIGGGRGAGAIRGGGIGRDTTSTRVGLRQRRQS